MLPEPRHYQNERDLARMQAILVAGRQAGSRGYYVHRGDFIWWLDYLLRKLDRREITRLWETPGEPGNLLGWVLFTPYVRTFDVFVHPHNCSTDQRREMVTWADEYMERMVRQAGGVDLRTLWVAEDDGELVSILEARGFETESDFMLQMWRSLAGSLADPRLPPGFQARPVMGTQEAEKRARASYEAFGTRQPFEDYLQNYLGFMESIGYAQSLDIVTAAPDGQFASFCICWLDETNKAGHLEPVGTRPQFQRMGLGKAVVQAGLKALQAHGMRSAEVCVESSNEAAIRLYSAAGFRSSRKILSFSRTI